MSRRHLVDLLIGRLRQPELAKQAPLLDTVVVLTTTQASSLLKILTNEGVAAIIELSHVDPEIIATQVIQINDATGFQLAPQRMKKLLRRPLVAAAPESLPSLNLGVRRPHASSMN